MSQTARFVQQVSRPRGRPTGAEFAFTEEPVPVPRPGTALVENVLLSVDPYMRENMDAEWELSTPLEGRSIGRVTDSRTDALAEGDLVFHRQGWRTHAVVDPEDVRVLPQTPGVPPETYLGILGGTGLTAHVALSRIARLVPGETVYVSAAAGGVGSAAGQLARLMGAGRVVGSAGSPAKVRLLTEELGFDAAFDHRAGRLGEQLAKAAPDGIDVYVDNVGGEHLEAAIGAMREFGRIAWCGAIAQYDATEPPPAPRNLFDLVEKSVRLEGFLVRNHRDAQEELEQLLLPALASGAVTDRHTVTEGFDGIVDAFLGMLAGGNTGKATVRVATS
ncbi:MULTISPECIES: NADP-dependent oxidoreductase [unclassified Streptomyces]|uniref:NADP-dependent oxidoreductase n=1 Tax=Streptomyces TaxID=1883 RepID=UPI0001C1CA95|nr:MULTISPECIES: NADP-dependent oxidoreductase [unclassified Streptomyces]AEN10074.1 Alcohol dehydrogenase zinc-binding domain protein [Streptomyces sp. SirexAA-E]MYR67064.1 zinc-binding dehydrogenase [Streptomyces sp. SID4939]MYS04007.1 zinc-binding dehydrogenase [Streptomyces sp. SID4940]MYT66140.1 zinc-binding dehydrogenase [Streptomyces sp. SID8357]MYT88202.1 zinc-binding dehydrogenase [Streptomyces sp. SID8360]